MYSGFRFLVPGYLGFDFSFQVSDFGVGVIVSAFMLQVTSFKFGDAGFRLCVSVLGFQVSGLRFLDSGFRLTVD